MSNFGAMNHIAANLNHNLSNAQELIDTDRIMLPSSISTLTVPSSENSASRNAQLSLENIMPGICLTKNFITWNKENLLAAGFTHIIIIDKHIQEFYYPSALFKLAPQADNAFSSECMDGRTSCESSSQLDFGKEFKVLDLNFGEKSYLTTVLPNCYRAVQFINKALRDGGSIVVIDCNGGEQKCLTIIVAYLMYKNNLNFSDAFLQLKGFYKKADLDRFYSSQLYEYEPILQVQRAQSRGHSSTRELNSALLKRKKEDDHPPVISESTNSLLHTFNPLTQFHPHQQQQLQATTGILEQFQLHDQPDLQKQQPPHVGPFHAWYDYVMESE